MISAQSEREKALAILQRVKESEGARPFSESIKARTANAFSLSTSFDIETGDLKRTSPIYELGFLHEGKDSVVAFGRPTEIGGGRQAAFSPFTKAKLKERFGSLFNARATFTQEGLRQKDIPAFALNQLKGRDVWVQNLPFERSFLSARMGKWDFTSWAVDAKLESFTGDSGLYATNPGLKRALHQANINQSSLSSLDNYLGSWGKVFDQFKGALEGPRIEGSTRVFDLMDLTRSVFAMAQTKGHMEKTGELFAGSSIEALSQAIFKMPEPHSALGDAVLQSEISKYMYSTGLSLQEGTLSDHQKDFFRRIGSIQKGLKQEGATKNIIDTFVSQQRFLYSHDPEDLASATIGSQTKLTRGHLQVLQPDGSYSEEPFEFTQRKRGDSTRLTTNIEDFIKGRSLEQSQRHGIQVDYDVAHKAARSLYIDRYQQALHEAGGDTRKALEATGDALASAGDTLKGRVSTLLEREAPKVGIGQTIKANWKLGAVALAGIGILGHLFSGKDDEYNYIEGLRHTGFSGESRALNTDFGSGWRGLIRIGRGEGSNIIPEVGRGELGLGAQIKGDINDRIAHAFDRGGLARPRQRIDSELMDAAKRGRESPVLIDIDKHKDLLAENSENRLSLESLRAKGAAATQDDLEEIDRLRLTLAQQPSESLKGTVRHERFHESVSRQPDLAQQVKATNVPEAFTDIHRQIRYGPEKLRAEEYLAHREQYIHHPMTMAHSPFYPVFRDLEAAGEISVTPRAGRIRARRLQDLDNQLNATSRLPGKDDAYNTIEGLRHGGIAGAFRKLLTNFGSPWQGQGRIDDENASRLSKRHTVGLNPNFQGSVGIRGIPSFRVEDADTVQAMFLMGSNMNLRLAGIDAPETEHEGFLGRIAQQQPFGQEAAARLQEILGQQESISAVFDPNAEGSYGRAPAVLFGDDGLNINLQLVQEGMAAALPFGAASDRIFDTNEFRKAQRDAQANQRGMWADAGWQAVYRGQSQAKTKLTHTSLTQPERVYENFRTAGSLMRLQNPDAELSEMQAAGGKDDFNIIEGLKHGWAQGNREFNIGDFGSGYIIDKTVNVMKKNTKTKRDLMKGQALARSQCRAMMDPENWTKHHIG